MKVTICIPKPRISTDRFLEVIDMFAYEHEFLETQDLKVAEVFLVQGQDDLVELYNPEKLFCVIQVQSEVPDKTFTNICVLNTFELFGSAGVEKLIQYIRDHRVARGIDPDM